MKHDNCRLQEMAFHVKKPKHDGHWGNTSDGRKTGNFTLIRETFQKYLFTVFCFCSCGKMTRPVDRVCKSVTIINIITKSKLCHHFFFLQRCEQKCRLKCGELQMYTCTTQSYSGNRTSTAMQIHNTHDRHVNLLYICLIQESADITLHKVWFNQMKNIWILCKTESMQFSSACEQNNCLIP